MTQKQRCIKFLLANGYILLDQVDIDYYALIGVPMETRQISCTYKSV